MRLDHLLSKEPTARRPRRMFSGSTSGSSYVDHCTIRVSQTTRPPCLHATGTTGTCAIGASLFRFEGVAIDAGLGRRRTRAPGPSCPDALAASPAVASRRRACTAMPAPQSSFENCIASTSINVNFVVFLEHNKSISQATKSQRWMPWRQMPMKDVGGCEKPRGAAYQALIRGCPNGETRLGSCPVTPA